MSLVGAHRRHGGDGAASTLRGPVPSAGGGGVRVLLAARDGTYLALDFYTFSDFLYDEMAGAPHAGLLLRVAVDVLVRDSQEPEFRVPDPAKRPKSAELVSLGIKPADARHVADAIGLGCQRFLTNDKRLRNKSDQVQGRWQLVLRRPSEFLVEAVQAGAPWTTRAPWPWDSIDRIRGRCPIIGSTEKR